MWARIVLLFDALGDMFMDEGRRTSWMRVTCFVIIIYGLYIHDNNLVITGLTGKGLQNFTELKSS
jgi:hypothetical protein